MASLSEIYIKKETLQTLLDVLNKKTGKDGRGVSLTLSINDESNEWGQNVTAYVSQTKDQREAKKPRFYIGNGKVFWNDGKIENGVKPEDETPPVSEIASSIDDGNELPF